MPCDYKEYPENWKWLTSQLKKGAGNKCELCHAENGQPHWLTNSKVVLTVHHIDSDKSNNTKQNLIVLCQRCHLRLDLAKHMKKRADSRRKSREKNQANMEICEK